MEHIAILTGGDSAEYEISLLSANTVLQHLDPKLFKGYLCNTIKLIFLYIEYSVIINSLEIIDVELIQKNYYYIYL